MVKLFILFTLFFNAISIANDDFGDEEERKPTREVRLRESWLTKKVSIFSINVFKTLDKYLLKPLSIGYDAISTENFQQSSINVLENYSSILSIPNNILTFSSDKTIASFGYFLFNSSIGLLGSADLAKEFNLNAGKTKTDDLLRFYGVPEFFFIVLPIPMTLPDVGGFGIDVLKRRYSEIPTINSFASFGLSLLNARMENPHIFDAMHKIDSSLIYDSYKSQRYALARYWKFERNIFPYKKLTLKENFEERKFEFLN